MSELVRIAVAYHEDLLHGLRNTLAVTLAVTLSSLVLGLLLGWAATWQSPLLRRAIVVYVDVFRGIPLLVLLWLVYFGLPTLPLVPILVSPFGAVFIAFTLCYAAYQAEIFRAGIGAIDPGQREAGLAQGMRPHQVFLRIVLPQTIRIVTPPTVNQFTDIIKSTALAGTVAYAELFRTANIIGTDSFRFLPGFLVVSAIYAAICLPLIWWMNRLDARLKRGTAY